MKSCWCTTNRDSNCGDCGRAQIILTTEEFQKIQEYRVALESTRADLLGANQELRDKINALEKGQADLIERLNLCEARNQNLQVRMQKDVSMPTQ